MQISYMQDLISRSVWCRWNICHWFSLKNIFNIRIQCVIFDVVRTHGESLASIGRVDILINDCIVNFAKEALDCISTDCGVDIVFTKNCENIHKSIFCCWRKNSFFTKEFIILESSLCCLSSSKKSTQWPHKLSISISLKISIISIFFFELVEKFILEKILYSLSTAISSNLSFISSLFK